MLKAYAKINLSLFVTGLREDGFHEIKSIFLKIGLFDAIWISPDTRPIVTSSSGPEGARNIVWEALKNRPYWVHIRKNIPIGAGLGGGSSDAAAVLKFFEKSRAFKSAHLIGSDVPFFLFESNAAIVTGRGEVVEPFEVSRPFYIVLFNPGIEFSTGEGYALLKRRKLYYHSDEASQKILEIRKILTNGNFQHLRELIYNSFEQIHQENFIKDFKEFMKNKGACCSLMTGSGSSMFAIFEEFPFELYQSYHDKFIFTALVT